MTIDRAVVGLSGKLQVSGGVDAGLRDRAVLLAPNHIGNFDPFVLTAACRELGLAPAFLLTAGILDTPVVGHAMRASGHLRVDRRKQSIKDAFDVAIERLRSSPGPVVCYPEGRIGLDPGLWPERGKTGVARMALAADVPVIPVAQWGAHEAMIWGCDIVTSFRDVTPIMRSFASSMLRRPSFKVHFGAPVDLGGLRDGRAGDARRAHERIMRAIVRDLVPLRQAEMDAPRFRDPSRPTTVVSPWRPE
ncbi:lysophospholipid acyltransferase family protein [Sciscionella marina]|uniref:lysophospholipid acyltransferase family protein n=1 Tax=Sciscionella marina TaxID=508770 RepID=UPI0003629407|nr:lysophospholipid acyltransferase family protein [Sciscionella marina]